MTPGAELRWCGAAVVVRADAPDGVLQMSLPDGDPGQRPAFIVSQETADRVTRHFEQYRRRLEFQLARWGEEKGRLMEALARDDL